MTRVVGDIGFPVDELPSPSYVVDEERLLRNLNILDSVQQQAGCKILLALKGFAQFGVFPLIGRYLAGVTSSSLYEARLGREEMDKDVHIFAPAYEENEFETLLDLCDHIVFNSFDQWDKYRDAVQKHPGPSVSCGIRVNPEYSEVETALYDPCAPFSRLGVTEKNFDPDRLDGIDGLHFHTMCEQNADTLERTLEAVERRFGTYMHQMKWINFGGGHHITRPDYQLDTLIRSVRRIRDTYNVDVYLEPGEAVALQTGFLVATVLDIVHNGMPIVLLDASAACHMPDVLEMPYRPEVTGAGKPGEKAHTYRLAGTTCLAGDVIGDYSFDQPLEPGDRLIFEDMAHYTMVKNNMFNGIRLPSIAVRRLDGTTEVLRRFGYADYRNRLS